MKYAEIILRKMVMVGSLSLMLLLAGGETLKAQFFGISIDSAIAYSGAKKSVSGGSLGITHPIPFIPNLGYSTLTFSELEEQKSTD